MNCLAHAYRFLDDPYYAAGTGVPDWLSMADRKTRVRRREVDAFLLSHPAPSDPAASLARGILQHLGDDDWFHVTPAFSAINQTLSRQIADCLGAEDGHRSGFLAHILVELLLDSAIAERQPGLLEGYYLALTRIDPLQVQQIVNRIARKPTASLAPFLPLYQREKFLYDYLENRPLLRRINGVMRRAGLPAVPDAILPLLEQTRQTVRTQRVALLTPSSMSCG